MMNTIINILFLLFMMGFLVFVHELGHFLWAKKFGVYIYEFSIGMGPLIKEIKGKDGINYSIRALPIGGYVSMAGEVYEDDKKIEKEKFMCNKPWWQRLIILAAGVTNNFITAFLIFFLIACIWGATSFEPKISEVKEDSAFAEVGIEKNDLITKVNGKSVSTWDVTQILLLYKSKDNSYQIEVKKENGEYKEYSVIPHKEKTKKGKERNVFGFSVYQNKQKGFVNCLKYSVKKFGNLMCQMWYTITGLITGKVSINNLSGPVGIYSIVGETRESGIKNLIYLVGFLSLNLGFVNFLPFPAFDGGRAAFILIEKIIGRPINSNIENAFHTVGFVLIMMLMIYITIHDVINLF